MLDELRQGAHGGALGGEWGELVAMFQEDVDQEFGIGGVIFGPAWGKGFAVLGHGERVDGKEHKAIIVAQRGYDRSFIEFQAHSDRLAVETRPEGLDPGMNRLRTMVKAQKLSLYGASGLEANSVFRISPVEANKGRKGFGYVWLHV
jgi:hypothetical protein